ncbi:magnesium transporter, putative [Actinidia rufa]|uniref:Probable magnesium transporter n=1 Tax=Actinidia rufa TaxID=165716 RepID=A0A7J0EQ02_9ERIC|nr:magnesium transporter, putative [Actinidia rufa]
MHLLLLFCAVPAHIILKEKLHIFGILGCALRVVGSTTIVLHASQEREIESVKEVWDLATEPALVLTAVFILILQYVPQYGQTHIMVHIGVCSLVGSLSAFDTFNTAVVSPIYCAVFTCLTILVSVIMFKDWDRQNPTQIVTEMCGFVTILSGTFLLHKTKDMADGSYTSPSVRLSKVTDEEDVFGLECIPLKRPDALRLP